jgi:hypothetical protein
MSATIRYSMARCYIADTVPGRGGGSFLVEHELELGVGVSGVETLVGGCDECDDCANARLLRSLHHQQLLPILGQEFGILRESLGKSTY